MAKGGSRVGSGRPRKGEKALREQILDGCQALNLTPLEYMLRVVNDVTADEQRRDRMAQAAAPYVHPKAGEPAGKKADRDAKARVAQHGTEWEDLLNGPSVQ